MGGYGKSRDVVSVTILDGASLSGAVQLGARRIVGLIMPAAWTAAGIAFQADLGSGVFGSVRTPTAEATATAAASQYIALDTLGLDALGSVKVRSGTESAPVNQTGADRVIKLVVI